MAQSKIRQSIVALGVVLLAFLFSPHSAGAQSMPSDSTESGQYSVDAPGTITFTSGSKIEGKVEKPQVIIFLPKQDPVFESNSFEKDYTEDLQRPLTFNPTRPGK